MSINWEAIGPGAATPPFFSNGAQTVENPFSATRQSGRAFFGESARHSGATDGNVSGGSWLQSVTLNGVIYDHWDYLEDMARVVVTGTKNIQLSAAVRALGGAAGSEHFAVSGLGINDGDNTTARGAYLEAVMASSTARTTKGLEVQIAQLTGEPLTALLDAYNYRPGKQAVGVTIASGAGIPGGRTYATHSPLIFAENGSCFKSPGIVFGWDAFLREGQADDTTKPGNSGIATVMQLANEHVIEWLSASTDGSGLHQPALRLWSSVTDPSIRWEVKFANGALTIGDGVSPSYAALTLAYNANAEAGILLTPGAPFGRPTIGVTGLQTNIDLALSGKGSGMVTFGTFTAAATTIFNCIGYWSHKFSDGIVRKVAIIS